MRGIDADRIVDLIDEDEILAEYERLCAEARSAAGTPAEAQGKTATTDGPVRFTAPSIVFRTGDRSVVAGGWQPLLADVLLANLDLRLERVPPPDSPEPLLALFAGGLTTAEIALLPSVLIAQGVHPKVISEQLGHASVQITMDRYSHLFDRAYSDVSKELEAAWAEGEPASTLQAPEVQNDATAFHSADDLTQETLQT